jgi:hypothetical protein
MPPEPPPSKISISIGGGWLKTMCYPHGYSRRHFPQQLSAQLAAGQVVDVR